MSCASLASGGSSISILTPVKRLRKDQQIDRERYVSPPQQQRRQHDVCKQRYGKHLGFEGPWVRVHMYDVDPALVEG